MKINISTVIIFMSLLAIKPCLIYAQEKPEDITGHFFELFQANGSDAAFDYIFGTNKWINKQLQESNKVKVKEILPMMGQYYGYELIEKKVISESYVVMIFMLKFDRQPTKFSFSLYKPKENWQLIEFKTADFRAQDDEAGKKN
ncbi:MAG TPA: hypothetical protein PKW80_14235 [Bacteroidales bacterium]|nr:hypothetical protein [Bacteroidales bacterium]